MELLIISKKQIVLKYIKLNNGAVIVVLSMSFINVIYVMCVTVLNFFILLLVLCKFFLGVHGLTE